MDKIRNTKIVCTIGPASQDYDIMKNLVKAGMNVLRLNFSHGNYDQHFSNIEKIRRINSELNTTVAIMLDTKGPEIRTHSFEFGGTTILKGSTVRIYMEEVIGNSEQFSVTYKDLIHDVKVNSKILVDDGNITLLVTELDLTNNCIVCIAQNDAYVKDRRGINVPDVSLNMDFISERDRADLIFGCEHDVDFVAASFVRSANDIKEMRDLLDANGGQHIQIIAKIENMEGVKNLDAIIEATEGIMVARGDLGVEVPVYEVPIIQKNIIQKCHVSNKVVIVATQMLESMQKNPRPTRAEANDVATAVLAGSDAIMLSGETAAGKYPVESVKMMNDIATRMETDIDYRKMISDIKTTRPNDITSTIALAVAEASLNLPVVAIVAPTATGHTAKALSHFRVRVPVLAVTTSYHAARGLALSWGVHPIVTELKTTSDEVINSAISKCKEKYHLQTDEMVFVTCGMPLSKSSNTNMMKIEIIE